MTLTSDKTRQTLKRRAIKRRLEEMQGSEDMLLGLLDETKLDLLILALGLGAAVLNDTGA